PPYSIDEVLEFYEGSRFDYGVSLDHIILDYLPSADVSGTSRDAVPEPLRRRQELTLELAKDFLRQHKAGRYSFEPLGVAQGWSPKSYAASVKALQKMGYDYIALGGMVPLKSPEILACLAEIDKVRSPGTRLHLLGVSRTEHLAEFSRLGIASFDSTSPLRQAFKDDRDNYYANDYKYTALRIPQVEGNPTNDVSQQTEQFILVNSTKPLPKGLIYELLPKTTAQLPSLLNRRRLPAQLLERLNLDLSSPLKGMIHTATNPTGIIKDNSILKMLENSLSDGALYKYKRAGSLEADVEPILELLRNYWVAVSKVFAAAWALPPKKLRLMHGAGILSMGFIMDAITDRLHDTHIPTVMQYEEDLQPLKEICHWTAGYWDFGGGQQRKWNELQNTSKDIELLANYLIAQYKARVWNRPAAKAVKAGRAARR
ncbi:MAG TPA: tRNA-guanine transglycosylase DpdA, partial [Myxococcaceae bacterium]|nr:tRNA-guanine transglycosylase DpdA [Myxococcaceae bacterium]